MRNEDTEQAAPSDAPPAGSGLDSAFRNPQSTVETEPATSFKWVVVAGVVVWTLGAAIIVWSRFLSS